MSNKQTLELEPHVLAAIAAIEAERAKAYAAGVTVTVAYSVDPTAPKPAQP